MKRKHSGDEEEECSPDSGSGDSPTDYHNHLDMCGNDVKVDSTLLTPHALSDSDYNIYSTGGVVDHLNSSYADLSPTHSSPYFHYDSMQAYQSTYGGSAAAAFAAANYYPQTNPYGVISQSYNGSRSIGSQCKSSSSAALAAQASYLNPSPFSTSFNNSNSQTTQNAYCYGYPSTFTNSSGGSQSALSNCQQSALDYPSYAGFGPAGGYPSYYNTAGYGSYIPNSSNVNNSSSQSPPSISNPSSTTPTANSTYQLTQLSQQSDQNLSQYHHNIDDCPSPIKSDIHSNASTGGAKKVPSKSGRRGRRPPNPSPEPDNNLERVFVWDLEDTIILFNSLLSTHVIEGSQHNCNDCKCIQCIVVQLEQLLMNFAEQHFFYNDLETCDQEHVDDAGTDDNGQDLSNYNFQNDGFYEESSHHRGVGLGGLGGLPGGPIRGSVEWLRKMSFRYRRIKEVYTQYRNSVSDLLDVRDRDKLYDIQRELDAFTENRTGRALKCLEQITSRPKCLNVLVTTEPLVPSIAKVMIYGLAPHFNIDNIYGAAKSGKENIFQRIVNRYGKKCTYVAIGDGPDEERAAKKLDIPFWAVRCSTHLDQLYNALHWEHL